MNIVRPRRSAIETRPVLLGPVTYLKLGKSKDRSLDPLSLLGGLLPVYVDVLRRLAANGAEWVQIDEPCLVLDLDEAARDALRAGLRDLRACVAAVEDHARDLFRRARRQSRNGAVAPRRRTSRRSRARAQATRRHSGENAPRPGSVSWTSSTDATSGEPTCRRFSNVWSRPSPSAARITFRSRRLARCCTCRSISNRESDLDPDVKNWLAFAVQKMGELATLGKALAGGAKP